MDAFTHASFVLAALVFQAAPSPAAGGGFRANYSGTESRRPCSAQIPTCTITTFSGIGDATFLFKSTEAGSVRVSCTGFGCAGTGSVTLVSRTEPTDSLTLWLYLDYGTWEWGVTSGAGRFQYASGSGVYTSSASGNTYHDHWSGTLQW